MEVRDAILPPGSLSSNARLLPGQPQRLALQVITAFGFWLRTKSAAQPAAQQARREISPAFVLTLKVRNNIWTFRIAEKIMRLKASPAFGKESK